MGTSAWLSHRKLRHAVSPQVPDRSYGSPETPPRNWQEAKACRLHQHHAAQGEPWTSKQDPHGAGTVHAIPGHTHGKVAKSIPVNVRQRCKRGASFVSAAISQQATCGVWKVAVQGCYDGAVLTVQGDKHNGAGVVSIF